MLLLNGINGKYVQMYYYIKAEALKTNNSIDQFWDLINNNNR